MLIIKGAGFTAVFFQTPLEVFLAIILLKSDEAGLLTDEKSNIGNSTV